MEIDAPSTLPWLARVVEKKHVRNMNAIPTEFLNPKLNLVSGWKLMFVVGAWRGVDWRRLAWPVTPIWRRDCTLRLAMFVVSDKTK